MAWKGFLKESKFFMNYPGYYREGELYCTPENTYGHRVGSQLNIRKRKIQFWLAFPKAWLRFNYFMLCDKINKWVHTQDTG